MGSDESRTPATAGEERQLTAEERLARVEERYARGEIDLAKPDRDVTQTPMGTKFRGFLF